MKTQESCQKIYIQFINLFKHFHIEDCDFIELHTRGGKIFSAARRGTENPPCVLVSLAVKVLQKNSVCGLLAFIDRSDLSSESLSNCINFS